MLCAYKALWGGVDLLSLFMILYRSALQPAQSCLCMVDDWLVKTQLLHQGLAFLASVLANGTQVVAVWFLCPAGVLRCLCRYICFAECPAYEHNAQDSIMAMLICCSGYQA